MRSYTFLIRHRPWRDKAPRKRNSARPNVCCSFTVVSFCSWECSLFLLLFSCGSPPLPAVVVVIPVVFVWLLVTLYRLISSVGPHSPILTAIGFCIPFVNVLVLLSVSLNAQAWCKRRGIR